MSHHTHKLQAYREDNQVWVTFCEWCGNDTEEKLEEKCSERYKVVEAAINKTVENQMAGSFSETGEIDKETWNKLKRS